LGIVTAVVVAAAAGSVSYWLGGGLRPVVAKAANGCGD